MSKHPRLRYNGSLINSLIAITMKTVERFLRTIYLLEKCIKEVLSNCNTFFYVLAIGSVSK